MQRLFFMLIASATIITTAFGQESADSADTIKLTPEQKNLSAFVGNWELSVEGVEKKGSAEIKPILDGRFITEDVKLPFGDFDMEWHGVIGHNEGKKQYTGVWFDNANNTTHSTSGEANESGSIITFRGEQVGHGKFNWRISNDGKKTMTIEMFQVADGGKETPVMKVSGTKQSPFADQGEK
jgi:hypothetical protein